MGDHPKGEGVKVKGYSKQYNTFDGIYISWDNIETFSQLFLGQMYLLEEWRYKATVDKNYKPTNDDQKRRRDVLERMHILYKILYTLRVTIKTSYINNPAFKAVVDERSKTDPCFFINAFAVTTDPRITSLILDGKGPPSKIPLILYPSQRELVEMVYDCYKTGTRGLVEKSRGEGATEVCVAISIWFLKYGPPGTAQVWISNKLDAVHLNNDPDSIFMRLIRNIRSLPKNMFPDFKESKHFFNMRIVNPENGNTIKGAGGANPSRGGRATLGFIDEYAFIDNPLHVSSSIGELCNTDIYFSTPNGRNEFYMEKISKRRSNHTMAWYRNPSKCEKWQTQMPYDDNGEINADAWKKMDFDSFWMKRNEIEKDPLVLRQEIMIDYDCFAEEPVIPIEWILAAVKLGKMTFPTLRTCTESAIGFDVATGVNDRNVAVHREGRFFYKPHVLRFVKSPLNGAEKVQVLAKKKCVKTVHFDQNAYGEDISYSMVEKQWDQVHHFDENDNIIDQKTKETDEWGIRWHGVKGQHSAPAIKVNNKDLASDLYINYRAYSWFRTRERFRITYEFVEGINKNVSPKELIAMEHSDELIAELSTPKIIRDGKKFAVEKKIHIKKRNSNKSIDMGDAFILADDEEYDKELLVQAFDVSNPHLVQTVQVDFSEATTPFGAIHMDDRGILYVMIGLFYYNSGKFKIVWTEEFGREIISEAVFRINTFLRFLKIKDWYASESIMDTVGDGLGSLWQEFAQNNMYLMQNFNFEQKRAITRINDLFKNRRLIIDRKNRALIDNLTGLTTDNKGQFPKNAYAELLILLISSIGESLFKEYNNG